MTFFCNNNCVLRRSIENGIDVVQRFNRKVIVHFITYIEAPWFLDLSAIDPFIPYRTIRVLWRNKAIQDEEYRQSRFRNVEAMQLYIFTSHLLVNAK